MARRVRAHDWAATPLGPAGDWSGRLRLMVETVLASPEVSSLVCGPERILVYNDAAARLYGARHPAALGRPLPEAFPEGWAAVAPLYARAFAGEAVQVAAQPLDTRGEGKAADAFDATLLPVRDDAGAVAAVLMTGREVGARARAEAALRESEARFRMLFDRIEEGFCIADRLPGEPADFRYVVANPAFERQSGFSDPVGRTMRELVPGIDDATMRRYARVAATGRPETFEVQALGRSFAIEAVATDRPGQIAVLFRDVTAARHAEAALRESEARQAFLLKLGDAMRAQPSANAMIEVAARLLGERLGASRVMFAEFDEARGSPTSSTGGSPTAPSPSRR